MKYQSEYELFNERKITIEKEIAKGGFGDVYLVNSAKYNTKFAMKKVPARRFCQSEIDRMKSIDHVNMINLYSYYYVGDYVYLFMEYCPQDLHHLLKNSEGLSKDQMLKYIHDILVSINACHEKNIAHNDIKPSNFLIDNYGRIKVCDFGLSQLCEDHELSSNCKGTTLFMAPEVLKKEQHNPLKADIWSLGVTFYYMATANFPFIASCGDLLLKVINNANYPILMVRNKLLRQIIARCLSVNPDERPTISEILEMPYFSNYNALFGIRKKNMSAILNTHGIVKPKLLGDGISPSRSVIPSSKYGIRTIRR